MSMTTRTHKRRIGITLICTVLLLTAAIPALAAELTLRVHHFLGAESLPHQFLIEPWARRVERDSGGAIEVEIYPAMTLGGKAPELLEQVHDGSVDIIWTAAAYTPGAFPRSEVFTLPLVHQGDPVATNLAIRDLLELELFRDFEGIQPLLVHVHQGHAFHLVDHPVQRLEDFAGLTLRPPGRRAGRWTIESLGAEITKKRHPKLPKALANKALDGALMSFQLAESMGVVDAVDSHTLLEGDGFFGTSLYLFLMNKARYDALPSELRAVIDSNSGAPLAEEMGRVWRDAGNAGLEAARKRGNRIDVLQGQEAQRTREALQRASIEWTKEVGKQHIDGFHLIRKARQAIAGRSGQ
jgi:TRAP-type C4-dicarboxylate transport system substrate-binding protein